MNYSLTLKDIIGNEAMKTQLNIAFGASRLRNRPIPHILLSGIAGAGKTTTAQALAAMDGSYFTQLGADALKTPEDLAKVFNKLPDEGYDPVTGEIVGAIRPAIIFIDEIHQLSLKTEELLGITMEKFIHTYTIGRGKNKEIITTWVPKFTLVGATTKEGNLSKPFRDRFKLSFIFSPYNLENSQKIVFLHAQKMNLSITEEAILEIAKRGRGTPRLMVGFLERMADTKDVLGREQITADLVQAQFELLEIDYLGLTQTDRIILLELHKASGPTGLETLAIKTNQDKKTITEVNEPYLIRVGLIERSGRGRLLTDLGTKHLTKLGYIEEEKSGAIDRVIHRKKR